ncbi:hypothetical protein D3C87_1582660 [compost metagenome]
MQRRNQVVVPVLRLVVDRGAPLHHGKQARCIECLARLGRGQHFLHQTQQGAAIAIGQGEQRLAGLGIQRQGRPGQRLGALHQLFEIVEIE